MKLTRFALLRDCVESLHAPQGVDGIANRLLNETVPVSLSQLIIGQSGIWLTTVSGAVTRVILYDAQISLSDDHPLLTRAVMRAGFDSTELISLLPRYHLTGCSQLE